MTQTNTVHALLIEDSDDDAEMIRRLATDSGLNVHLTCIANGETAIEYLTAGATRDAATGAPQVVLLDLSLPKADGIEVLRRIKSYPELADIPVIILSGSENEEDIRQGQDLKAHTHIVKPMTLKEFSWIIRSIENYWLRLARVRALDATS